MPLFSKEIPSSTEVFRQLHRDDNLSCGEWSDFFILVWHNETTELGVKAMARAFATFEHGIARPNQHTVGLLTVVEPNAPLPAHDARRALARFLADKRLQIAASAVVFEGGGFRAAAVRGVVTGLTIVAQQPFPHRVFGDVREAAEWMCGAGPASWASQVDRLVQAQSKLRR